MSKAGGVPCDIPALRLDAASDPALLRAQYKVCSTHRVFFAFVLLQHKEAVSEPKQYSFASML